MQVAGPTGLASPSFFPASSHPTITFTFSAQETGRGDPAPREHTSHALPCSP